MFPFAGAPGLGCASFLKLNGVLNSSPTSHGERLILLRVRRLTFSGDRVHRNTEPRCGGLPCRGGALWSRPRREFRLFKIHLPRSHQHFRIELAWPSATMLLLSPN